jgi:PAS domain-containing protein
MAWRTEKQKKERRILLGRHLISPIIGDDGNITHYIAVKEDISDRKMLINQLIEARDRASGE